MAVIESVEFNNRTPDKLNELKYGKNWPVVYILNNDKEAYIGETINAVIRSSQHLKTKERKKLKHLNLISDDDFNRSVILDLEAFLINYMSADGKYKLQNSNMGVHLHDYYERDKYEKTFDGIWRQLRERQLIANSIHYIENTDTFKYSPYKALNLDQYRVVDAIIQDLVDIKNTNKMFTTIIDGGAGTGKTVLAIYLMKLLSEAGDDIVVMDTEIDPGLHYIAHNLSKLESMKIGLVVPMQSLRYTIKKVFGSIKGLKKSMVLSPYDVVKTEEPYDLLIVDEAHRLQQRKALSNYATFDKNNEKLGFDQNGTQLDWILKCSKNQIFFYDSMQSVKPSDVKRQRFYQMKEQENVNVYCLMSQFRCRGGNSYIKYIKELLSDHPPRTAKVIENYEFRLFEDVNDMVNAIRSKDEEHGLCRVVAGYSWKWLSKKTKDRNDIFIDGYAYMWNSVNKDWVNSENAINEIGCIHTVQGYDLNYAGVILGNEIKYDPQTKSISIDKKNYFDLQGKTSLEDEGALKSYIINIYLTLLTRGIKGTYVYACDENLRNYLKKFIPLYQHYNL